MRERINGSVLDLGARRIFTEEVVALPIPRRPDGPRNKAATAIRADVAQHLFDTGGAKGALVGADARFQRIGRQRFVAVLAARPEFKHGASFP